MVNIPYKKRKFAEFAEFYKAPKISIEMEFTPPPPAPKRGRPCKRRHRFLKKEPHIPEDGSINNLLTPLTTKTPAENKFIRLIRYPRKRLPFTTQRPENQNSPPGHGIYDSATLDVNTEYTCSFEKTETQDIKVRIPLAMKKEAAHFQEINRSPLGMKKVAAHYWEEENKENQRPEEQSEPLDLRIPTPEPLFYKERQILKDL